MSTYVAVFALILAYLALVAAFVALRTLARLRRATAVLTRGGPGEETLLEATERHIAFTRQVGERLYELQQQSAEYQQTALRRVALVRYDAFDGMAGRMSFSLALLDEQGDGIALSALAGRGDTRVYAKGVAAGAGQHELSPEERQAVQAALKGVQPGTGERRAS